MNELESYLERLVISRILTRELYRELENALFEKMFFAGNIERRTIQNAKVLLDQLISEQFPPQFIKARYGTFFFGWGSLAGAATQCALSITVYSDGLAIRAYDVEISICHEIYLEGVPQLNETQLENFKEMLGIRQT
jgi:hypothetical protein